MRSRSRYIWTGYTTNLGLPEASARPVSFRGSKDPRQLGQTLDRIFGDLGGQKSKIRPMRVRKIGSIRPSPRRETWKIGRMRPQNVKFWPDSDHGRRPTTCDFL